MEHAELKERAERARRLSRAVTDAHMRLSLEALADEYEAQMPQAASGDDDAEDEPGFMLKTRH